MSGGPQCPHSLALQPRYLHGCSSAALCTSGLGVHGEWLAEQSMKPRMSPAEPAPSTQTPQLLCPPRQQVLGIALTENHGTDVDIPENIFRRGQSNLHPSRPPSPIRQAPSHLQFSSASSGLSVLLAGESAPSL